jgi:hypothetical protein
MRHQRRADQRDQRAAGGWPLRRQHCGDVRLVVDIDGRRHPGNRIADDQLRLRRERIAGHPAGHDRHTIVAANLRPSANPRDPGIAAERPRWVRHTDEHLHTGQTAQAGDPQLHFTTAGRHEARRWLRQLRLRLPRQLDRQRLGQQLSVHPHHQLGRHISRSRTAGARHDRLGREPETDAVALARQQRVQLINNDLRPAIAFERP